MDSVALLHHLPIVPVASVVQVSLNEDGEEANEHDADLEEVCSHNRVQPTVTFPIGDHVNVFHDCKKTGPSKILKRLSCRCHYIFDMLVEFCQNHIFLTFLKWLNVA